MQAKLEALYKTGKVSKIEFQVFNLFVMSPLGADFLNSIFESILMEEAIEPTQANFAWLDGRRSCWRDIKLMINKVKYLLEGKDDDRRIEGFQYGNSQS